MVHYIRFLRTPYVSTIDKKSIEISAVAAITTDLGDDFYAQDQELVIRLIQANHPFEVCETQNLYWREHSRALKFSVSCSSRFLSHPIKVHVFAKTSSSSLNSGIVPDFIDLWSDAFTLANHQRADNIVERRFSLPNGAHIKIWEEIGDSIARHIWDASLGFLIYFKRALSNDTSTGTLSFSNLVTTKKTRPLKVLELGAGCGIVGIAFAQLMKCEMLLTDLADAQSILQRNIECAIPASGSKMQRQVFEWGSSLGDSSDFRFDLILVSDCIYNPESSLHLVDSLCQLASLAPKLMILVGFKRRHEADTIFFDRMSQSKFETLETCNITLPHPLTSHDVESPNVEFYTYRMRL